MKNDLSASKILRKKVKVRQQLGLYRPKIDRGGACWSDPQACSDMVTFSFLLQLRVGVPFGRTLDGKIGCPVT